MKIRVLTLLIYFLPGLLTLICFFIFFTDCLPGLFDAIKMIRCFFDNNIQYITLALFGLLFIAFFILSIIRFRDRYRNLVSFKKVNIPKLHVALGLFLIPLLVLFGGTVIKMEVLSRDEVKTGKPVEISSGDVARLSGNIDSLMVLNTRTDSLIKELKKIKDQLSKKSDSSSEAGKDTKGQ